MKAPIAVLLTLVAALASCKGSAVDPVEPAPIATPAAPAEGAPANSVAGADEPAPPTVEEAAAFVERYNREGYDIGLETGKAAWTYATNINADTELLRSKAVERQLKWASAMLQESKRFRDLPLTGDVGRAMDLLRTGTSMPAPSDPEGIKRLAALSTQLSSAYATAKYCKPNGKGGKLGEDCRDLEVLMKLMKESRDYDALLDAWTGWRTTSRQMRPLYTEFAALMNEGAKELGFEDTGALWRGGYDMTGDEFADEVERLWSQVKPLYEQLHCYVRAELVDTYGADKVAEDGPIPAHLLGNMWAQTWGNVYDLVKPYPKAKSTMNVDRALKRQKYDAVKMVKSAEEFYTSMGLVALPDTFWERSLLVKPDDREVMCHASAWPIDPATNDFRIKMCIDVTREELEVIYHELGHVYYFAYYKDLPYIFQSGAHDGFHEAIGDAVTLSMTPAYYEKVGLARNQQVDTRVVINQQMQLALDKIAFLPFGKLIDQWRWGVFSGAIPAEDYNAAWWRLRREYQGIAAPVERTETDFDPGAKMHVPGNTPYTRYFLAHILQFQMHRALCEAAGHEGPLHTCSVYGSKEAGEKLAAMLSLGQSQPWTKSLEALTGSPSMDASAMLEYFKPLQSYLEEQNKDRTCGWR